MCTVNMPAQLISENWTTVLSYYYFFLNLTNPCRSSAGTNNTLTCLEDGLWSFPEALCELRCPAPPPVPNAMLQTKRCNETGLKVGTLCKYKCKPGYHVANKPKRCAKEPSDALIHRESTFLMETLSVPAGEPSSGSAQKTAAGWRARVSR